MSREYSSRYGNLPISVESLRVDHYRFRNKRIPALLKRSDVAPEEKIRLQQLKDNKKWNPYNMRHSSITKYARNPNINEYSLRQHCGWTKTSNMIEVYTHELKGESLEDVMLACGIDLRDKKQHEQLQQELQGKHCRYCRVVNRPDARFCRECKLVLTTEAYNETIEEADKTKKEFEQLKKNQKRIETTMSSTLNVIMGLSNAVEIHAPDDDLETNRIEELARKQPS